MNTVMSVCVALPAAYAFSRLPVPGRQAPVLLAADQPDGTGGGVSRCRSSSCIRRSGSSTPTWRSRWPTTSVQHPAGGVDPGRLHVGASRSSWTKRPMSTAIPSRAFFVKIFLPTIKRPDRRGGILLLHVLLGGVAAGQDADGGRGQADCRDHDQDGLISRATSSGCWPPPGR